MARRNIIFNSEMLDLETKPSRTYLYREHQTSSHDTNAPASPSIHLMLSSLGSTANLNPYPLFGHYESNIFYGNYNASGDPNSFNWSYMPHMRDLQGRSVSGGNLEIGSRSEQKFWNTMSSNNSVIFLHPSNHYHNYHSLPLQGIQGHNYHFHHQMPAPFFRHPMNDNIHHCTIRNSEASRESMSSNPRHFYGSRRRKSQYASIEIIGHIRILLSEEVTILEFPRMQPNTNVASYEAEYEENDKIRILEYGHDYHVDYIKQWLLLKNVCPMCKRPAFCV